MKKTFLLLAGSILMISASFAQQDSKSQPKGRGQQHHEMRKGQGNPFMKGITLTEEQKTQMQSMHKQFAAQRKMIMDDEKITVKQQRDKLFLMQKSHALAMQQLLTPEQKEQLKNKGDQFQNRKQGFGKMQGRGPSPMANKLGLTEDQKQQLKSLNSKKADRFALMQQSPNREAFEKALENQKVEHKAALEKILTPEQFKQLEEMQKQKPMQHGGMHRGGMQRGPKTDKV